MKTRTRERLADNYGVMSKWAMNRYGMQDGMDYLHDAVVMMLEKQWRGKLGMCTNDEFLGIWKIRTHGMAQLSWRNKDSRCIHIEDNASRTEAIEESSAPVRNKISQLLGGALSVPHTLDFTCMDRWAVRSFLNKIPHKGRAVINQLYVLEHSVAKAAKVLKITPTRLTTIHRNTLAELGRMYQEEEKI